MILPKITKRKDGRFCANVSLGTDPETGRQKRKTVYGKTKNEVKQKLKDLTQKVATGEISALTKEDLTMKEWCETFLSIYSFKYSAGTLRSYKGYIKNYIIPRLGNKKLSKITPLLCQNFVKDLIKEDKIKENTINYIFTFLKSLLNKAVELDYIPKNPAKNVELPSMKKPEISPFSEEEIINFLKECKETTIDNLLKFTLYTGLREHEVFALTWDSVNNNTLVVDKQFSRNKVDKAFYPTKNKRTRRVALSPRALEILDKQKRIQAELRISKGKDYRNDLNLIFTDRKGDRLNCNTVYRRFKKICSEIGSEGVRFHDLRHSYAVISLRAGVDIKTISDSLGHYSVSFTLDRYAYVTEEMLNDSAKKLEEYFNFYEVTSN